MQSNRGFTMVELLIVITIIGIVSALAVPQMGSQDDLRLSAAARSLMADVAYARNLAIQTQQKQFVQFTQQQYALLHSDGGTGMLATAHPIYGGNYTISFGAGTLSRISLGTVNIGTQSTLGFDALGSPASYNTSNQQFVPLSTSASVQLQSEGRILTISIEPYTGEMSVSSS